MPQPGDDDGDDVDSLEYRVLAQWLRESQSAVCHPVAYGGKMQTTPSAEYAGVVTIELMPHDAVPKTQTMDVMEHEVMPGIKQPIDGVVAIAEIADAASALDCCYLFG